MTLYDILDSISSSNTMLTKTTIIINKQVISLLDGQPIDRIEGYAEVKQQEDSFIINPIATLVDKELCLDTEIERYIYVPKEGLYIWLKDYAEAEMLDIMRD